MKPFWKFLWSAVVVVGAAMIYRFAGGAILFGIFYAIGRGVMIAERHLAVVVVTLLSLIVILIYRYMIRDRRAFQ